jgi:hypothetical protein
MAAVTPVAVSIQPKMLAAATMNMTVAVVSTVSRQTFTNIFEDSGCWYQPRPSTMAQTQAAMAPSVGVNSAGRHAANEQHGRHDGQHRLEVEESIGR